MSDSYSGGNYSGIVNISLADDSGSSKALDRATKLLAGIPGGIEKAASSSLTRAATSGTAAVAREVNKDYSLNTSDFKKYTKSSQHIQKSGDEISVGLSFRGFHGSAYPVQRKNHQFRAVQSAGQAEHRRRNAETRFPCNDGQRTHRAF